MAAINIDGKALSKELEKSLKSEVDTLVPKLGRKPMLAVVLVGENPASKVYVKSKTKRAIKAGLDVKDFFLPADVSNEELQKQLKELSSNKEIDGILLQLPLPKNLDEYAALCSISPEVDADGLTPFNQGLLVRGADGPEPCTPKGCISLIEKAREELGLTKDLSGLHATVVGRSVLVGKPMSFLLLEKNCTVTIAHSRTKDLASECKRADILVAAVGRPEIIGAEYVKPGAIVIDVGINRLDDGSLVGDVDYEAVSEIAAAITPVPGGVGPMTISMLLRNTVDAASRKI